MSLLKSNYFKLLFSGLAGTSALLVSAMVDSLIAGKYLSAAGLTAVSLVSPYFSVNSFLCSMVLSGASISINQSVGAKDMELANRQFSSTLYAQALIGLIFSLISVMLLNKLPALLGGGETTAALMRDYLGGVAPFTFIFPISAFMSSITYYDGDVKVAASGQILSIAANIALSIYLSQVMGIRGIALATVLSNIIGCCVYALHFITKKCTFRLVRAFDVREIVRMAKIGMPGISAYLFVAVAIAVVNNYIGRAHGEYALYLFAISNTLIGAFTNITGAAGEALAPMASLYFGEDNDIMLKRLLVLSLKCVLILSFVAAFPIYFCPQAICRLYSVDAADVQNVTRVLQMFATSLFLSGIGNTLAIYYMVNRHTGIAFMCSFLRCHIFFMGSFLLLGTFAYSYMWFGVSLSEALTMAVVLTITSIYGRRKNLTPLFLLERGGEERLRVWDFSSNMDNFLSCGREAEALLIDKKYAKKSALDVTLLLEEMGTLLSKYKCRVEVTLIMGKELELVIRDNSPKWDIANEDGGMDSFIQYAALQILNKKAQKQFFRTTGCNKISFSINA